MKLEMGKDLVVPFLSRNEETAKCIPISSIGKRVIYLHANYDSKLVLSEAQPLFLSLKFLLYI